MARGVIAYSGLITKTRAMKKNLLNQEQLGQLTELATVNEAVSFLRSSCGYGDIYRNDVGEWHRGQAEAMIRQVLWRDYEKLYHFCNAGQRAALELIFARYEVNYLKECLKRLYQEERIPLADRGAFFRRHAGIPVKQGETADNVHEFLQYMKGTPYEPVFRAPELERAGYGAYAFALDLSYYTNVYRKIKKQRPSTQRRILLQLFGTQIDWLNIMWVYRLKRSFALRTADIYARMIPIQYRLKGRELTRMIEAASLEELNQVLEQTAYFKGKDAYLKMEDEISYGQVLDKTYRLLVREHPMSMAPVLQYLHERKLETERITSVIEGIRYQVPPKDIRAYILLDT